MYNDNYTKPGIMDLKNEFGEQGKMFIEFPNEIKQMVYEKIEELRSKSGEIVIEESLKKYEELLKYFSGLDQAKWDTFGRKLAYYNAYLLGSKALEEYLLRNNFEGEPEKLKLLFNESGKYPYRPMQMYQIGISLKRDEVKKVIKDLEKSSWVPRAFNARNKELLEMSWDELRSVDKIISVE